MKKIIILLTLLVLVSGCQAKEITKEDLASTLNETLSYKIQGANNYFDGYKYYLPRGFQVKDKRGNNHVLVSDGDYYYLYVDIISYFHSKEIETTFDKDLYFSKKISYNGISGYIKVSNPNNGVYYIDIVHNYSRIEAYVKEENLKYAIENAIRILASIKYNDDILEILIGEKTFDYEEEIYNFFESKREDGNFLDYIEEYDVYNKKENVIDEDIDENIIDSSDE